MKKLLLFGAILFSSTAFPIDLGNGFSLTGDIYGGYHSAYIPESGAIFDRRPVMQLGIDTYINKGNFSWYTGGFGSYSFHTIPAYYKHKKCWGESDFMIGPYYSYDNWTFGLTYERWNYPNMLKGIGHIQHVMHTYISYRFSDIMHDNINFGHFTAIFDPYIYLGKDPYGYRFDWRPKIDHDVILGKLFDHDIKLKNRLGMVFRTQQHEYPNGPSSVFYKLALSYYNFTIYYQHWLQVDKDIYSSWSYDKGHNQYGISYTFNF